MTQITVVCFWSLLQTKWLVHTAWLLYIRVRFATDKVEHVSRDASITRASDCLQEAAKADEDFDQAEELKKKVEDGLQSFEALPRLCLGP